MIPIEARTQPTGRTYIAYSPLTPRGVPEDYVFVPSGYTYGVPQRTGTYVPRQHLEESKEYARQYEAYREQQRLHDPQYYEYYQSKGRELEMPFSVQMRGMARELIGRGTPWDVFLGYGVQAGAGLAAIPEAFIRPVPTISGGLVGTILSPVTHGRFTTEPLQDISKVAVEEPFYIVGGGVGEVAAAMAIGWGVGKAWGGLKWLGGKTGVSPVITRHVVEPVRMSRVAHFVHKTKFVVKAKVPSYRGSGVDIWLTKHVKPYFRRTGGIARGEVSLVPTKQPISLAQMQAGSMAWQATATPKMAGLMIPKHLLKETVRETPMKHLIYRAGELSIGYLRPPMYFVKPTEQAGYLPFVTQKHLTRMGIVPYIPKTVYVGGKKAVSVLGVGLGISAFPRVAPKPRRKYKQELLPTPKLWYPTLARFREKFRPLTVLEPTPAQRRKTRQFSLPQLKQPQMLKQPQLQKMIQIMPSPLRTIPTLTFPTIPPFRLPEGVRDVLRGQGLFGKWFLREHPIATPKEVASQFFGSPRKKRRKKVTRKKTRKRRRKK